MKKVERETVKYLICLIVFTALCGFILYPFLDFIISNVFTKTMFVYSFNKHIIQPLIFAIIYGLSFWTLDKKKNK